MTSTAASHRWAGDLWSARPAARPTGVPVDPALDPDTDLLPDEDLLVDEGTWIEEDLILDESMWVDEGGVVHIDSFVDLGGGGLTAMPGVMSLFLLAFVVVLVATLVRAGQNYAHNAGQPERTVAARVVGRRQQTEGGGQDRAVRTDYFATFEVCDGERFEAKVPRREYALLAEGDEGQLTHQGTWFRGFERRRVIPVHDAHEAPGGPFLPPPATP